MERKELFEVVNVRGVDALPFLHGQFAADLMPLVDGQLRWSALLNAQGRVMHVIGALRESVDSWRLLVPFARGAELVDTLRRFVFRRKVRIELDASVGIAQVDAGIDTGIAGLRCAVVEQGDPLALSEDALDSFIRVGLCLIDAIASGHHLAHSLHLQQFEAFSVKKGCYPGQEIVARTHFLGRNKRILVRLAARIPATWHGGDRLFDGETVVGEIVSVGRTEALAVMMRPTAPGDVLGLGPDRPQVTVVEAFAGET
ncbi:MAG TPA: hypothetical protein VN581_03660 [Patescibacteria group bacterium]|nr:hypothetical protein [Patescibacteria group bacterium]